MAPATVALAPEVSDEGGGGKVTGVAGARLVLLILLKDGGGVGVTLYALFGVEGLAPAGALTVSEPNVIGVVTEAMSAIL